MTKMLYQGYVEIEADLERGVVWVNDRVGRCRIRICNISKLEERVKDREWNVDVAAKEVGK